MAKRRKNIGGGAFDGTSDQMLQQDADFFGQLSKRDAGRELIRTLPLMQVWPDLKQPRRVVPASIRKDWDGSPVNAGAVLNHWMNRAGELSGLPIPAMTSALIAGEDVEQSLETENVIASVWLDLVGLAASIKVDGLQNPITVVQSGDNYVVETGERRWMASLLLRAFDESVDSIKARIVQPNVWAQAAENGRRQSLNAIGMARQLALLIMAMYEDQEFQPYETLVQPGTSDRAYYAQVSELQIRRGFSQRVLDATGLKSKYQISQYRRLLTIPDDLWQLADEENWTEFKIRGAISESVTPPESSPGLTTVNLTSESKNDETGHERGAMPFDDYVETHHQTDDDGKSDVQRLANNPSATYVTVPRERLQQMATSNLVQIKNNSVNGVRYGTRTRVDATDILNQRSLEQAISIDDLQAMRTGDLLALVDTGMYRGVWYDQTITHLAQRELDIRSGAAEYDHQMRRIEKQPESSGRKLTDDELSFIYTLSQYDGGAEIQQVTEAFAAEGMVADISYLLDRKLIEIYHDLGSQQANYRATEAGLSHLTTKQEEEMNVVLESTERLTEGGVDVILRKLSQICSDQPDLIFQKRQGIQRAVAFWNKVTPDGLRQVAISKYDPELKDFKDRLEEDYLVLTEYFNEMLAKLARQIYDTALEMRKKYPRSWDGETNSDD